MSEPFTTIKISEQAAANILDQVKTVQAVVIGMIAALESPLYVNYEGNNPEVHGAGHFVIDPKSVLATYGRVIWDEFMTLSGFLEKLEKNNNEH